MYYQTRYYLCRMNSTELLKGTLSTIIIRLLSEHKKMYGYEIAQHVKILSYEKILLKEGTLEPDGLVEVEQVFIGKRVRKYYSLTAKGKAQKKEQLQELREFLDLIHQIVFPETKTALQ